MAHGTDSNVSFLLGAGVSLPAGMPTTEQITDAVLNTSGVVRHSSGLYCRNVPFQTSPNSDWERLQGVQSLLPFVRGYSQAYFNDHEKERLANYEDLYYLSAQLHDHLSFEYENPAVEEFAKHVGGQVSLPSSVNLAEVAEELCGYIEDTVCSQLFRNPTRLDHLGCLVEAARDPAVRGCTIFTLNHDRVIERVLENNSLAFGDGFKHVDGDVRWWDARSLGGASGTRLLKLHGSIDWYACRRGRGNTRRTDFARVITNYLDQAGDRRGRTLPPSINRGRPLLLLGTFNKMLHYTGGLFADLFCLFRQILMQSQCLIVSGYSFRDKGVNRALVEWLNRSRRNRMVIVHLNPQQLRTTARGAIRNPWEELVNRGQLRLVESWFEDVTWSGIQSRLF